MARNYQKEHEWHKNKYTRILANIDKELAEQLKNKLKDDKMTIARWITDNAKKYLKIEEQK